MKVKVVSGLISLIVCTSSHAGLFGLTWNSRANCINNESVTWDALHSWDMQTKSVHQKADNTETHTIDTPRKIGHRSAAIHWREGFYTPRVWVVMGTHTIWKDDKKPEIMTTWTNNCSIYDGWFGPDEPDHPPKIASMNEILDGKSYANVLLHFSDYSKMLNAIESESSRNSFGLKVDYTAIPNSFEFTPPVIRNAKIIGFAPLGGYANGKWDGMKEFFSVDDIGTCSFSDFPHNGKKSPYTTSVKGNDHDGWLYTIDWDTDKRWLLLECADKKKDERIMSKVLEIAQSIMKQ